MMLSVEEVAPGSTPTATIVFLPGGGLGGGSWRPVAQRLPEYRSLLVDLPEHGGSVEIGPFSMRLAAVGVREVIGAMVGERAHVVGFSLGAQVTVQLLADASEVVETAFVIGCSVRPLPWLRNRHLLRLLFGLYVPFQNMPRSVRANARALGAPASAEHDFARDTRALAPGRLARIVSASLSFRTPVMLQNGRTPVTIAVGGRELGHVKRSATDLVTTLSNGRAYEVTGRTHGWPISEPQLCADAVRAAIRNTPLPEAFRATYR